jgi:hypothetical protein|tara:strand:- start:1019 stop:1180 length:162 start_codon:yes stop_codon:yes gene_type:complete
MKRELRLLQIGFLILAAAVIFLSYIIVQQQETINVINDFFYFLNELINEGINV